MSTEDVNELSRLHEQERQEFETCKTAHRARAAADGAGRRRAPVRRRAAWSSITWPKRVDFRELVKAWPSEFQTRIEMRQIGVRDEAKLLADYGDCGKPVCCNTHLSEMPPVSMKMAKLQKATLDPTKISGRCGRLKCCLRYEYDTYEALQKELPPVGSDVVTSRGRARVLGPGNSGRPIAGRNRRPTPRPDRGQRRPDGAQAGRKSPPANEPDPAAASDSAVK